MICHCFRMDIVPAAGRITAEICTAAQQANVLAYKRACCKIEYWKIRSNEKLAGTVKTAVPANFFKA